MKIKLKPHQLNINWSEPEPLALVAETTTDGARIAAEKAQQTQDRQEAESNQLKLSHATHTD